MNILWCGGEDIDFLDSGSIFLQTNSSQYRSSYARHAITGNGGYRKGPAFAAGSVTSCWISARCGLNSGAVAGRWFGLVDSATAASGIWIGADSSADSKLVLSKFDGTTMTTLATSATAQYVSNIHTLRKIDVQLINFGATATVNVYVDGGLALTYSGNVAVTGVTAVDCVGLAGGFGNGSGVSEIIVADADTRSLSLMTMAPTGAGSTTDWSGAYTDANEATNSDASNVSTNATAQDEQFDITDLAAGTYQVIAVKAAARAAIAGGSTPTGLKLGFKSGGSTAVGSTLTPGSSYGLAEELFATNPVTSAAWAQSDMNALQLTLRSN